MAVALLQSQLPGGRAGTNPVPDAALRAEVRDARSGNRIKAVNFLGAAFAPVAMAVLDDIEQSAADELALLAFRREGGDLRVQERDGGDGTLVRNTPIP